MKKIDSETKFFSLVLSFTLVLTISCDFERKFEKAKKTVESSNTEIAEIISQENGISIGKFSPNSTSSQFLAASPDSDLGNSSLSLPPGTFAVESEVSFEKSIPLVTNENKDKLEITTDFRALSQPVSINSSSEIEALIPMTIALDIKEDLGLTFNIEKQFIIVIFHYESNGQSNIGIILGTDLALSASQVSFDFIAEGAYKSVSFQLAKIETEIKEAKIIATDKAPKTFKQEEKDIAEAKISDSSDQKIGNTTDILPEVADQTPTENPSIIIAGGSALSSKLSVDLTLSASKAAEMYVTNTADCASDGIWEAYAVSKTGWTLAQTNSTATVYVKYRNTEGNESSCANDTIVHDNLAPASTSIMISSGAYTSSASPTVFLAATGASEMYLSNTPGCTSGGSWEAYSSSRAAWALAQSNSTATVYIKFRDTALNESTCINDTIIQDSVSPTDPASLDDGMTSNSANSSPNISWAASTDATSGISGYEVSIGTSSGASDTKDWTSVGNVTTASFNDLVLSWGSSYFANVRALDNATNESGVVSSDSFLYGFLQHAYLKASNGDASDWFGYSVAIAGDTLVVGAYQEDSNATSITNGSGSSADNTAADAGAVYVYKRTDNNWVQEAYIKASNAEDGDYFGSSVAISGDTLVVGAIQEDSNQTSITNGTESSANNSAADAGAVYVFLRTGSNWAQEAYIKASNAGAGDYFGRSVAILGDTLVVGAYYEDSNQTGITNGAGSSVDNSAVDAGAVYVYQRAGSNWTQEAYIKASNAEADDRYGYSVSISGDTMVVGAYGEYSNQTSITNGTSSSADNSAGFAGAVYVYKRTGSTWAQEAYVKASNAEAGDYFGRSVAISADTLVVGAYREDSDATSITNGTSSSAANSAADAGAVYIYKRTGSTWAQEAYVKASNAEADDYFGRSVAISGDTLIVGAHQEDSNQTSITNGTGSNAGNSAANSGAVYVYKRSGSTWEQKSYLKSSNAEAGDLFGYSVTIEGDTLAVGAYSEDSNQTSITNGTGASADNSATDAGAVYVIDK